MRRHIGNLLLASCAIGTGAGRARPVQGTAPPPPLNASKATPSYYAVEPVDRRGPQALGRARRHAPESAPGWRAFFDALKGELASYASAADDRARLLSLNRLHKMDLALWTVAWAAGGPGPLGPRRVAHAPGPGRLGRAPAGRLRRGPQGRLARLDRAFAALAEVRRRRPRLGPRRRTRGRRPSRPGARP